MTVITTNPARPRTARRAQAMAVASTRPEAVLAGFVVALPDAVPPGTGGASIVTAVRMRVHGIVRA